MDYEVRIDKATRIRLSPNKDLKKLYIEISSQCNFSCPMCFRHAIRDEFGLMQKDLFEKLLDDISSLPELEHVIFSGVGEPLIHPHFLDFVKALKRKDLVLTISTNGFFSAEHLLEAMVDLGVDRLVISSEPGEYGHPGIQLVKDFLERIQGIKNKRGADKPILCIESVLTQKNYEEYFAIINNFIALGVGEIVISNILPVFRNHASLPLYVGAASEEIEKLKRRLFSTFTARVKARFPRFELVTERHCDFINTRSTIVRYDGEVSPCYRFLYNSAEFVFGRKKAIKAKSFGNVKEKSLLDIWTSPEYLFFRFKVRHALFPSCTDCNFREGCQFVETTEVDCWNNSPSCGDCLWWRGIIICP